MMDAIPSQEILLDGPPSYIRFIESVQRNAHTGVHVLPARLVWNAEKLTHDIAATIAGPFEAICDTLIYFYAVDTLARSMKIRTLPEEPRD